jgi:hypothetical protein
MAIDQQTVKEASEPVTQSACHVEACVCVCPAFNGNKPAQITLCAYKSTPPQPQPDPPHVHAVPR